MQGRSRREMVFAVLEALYQKELTATQIMYKSNLNCAVIKEILGSLQRINYVVKLRPNRGYGSFYGLTENGMGAYVIGKKGLEVLDVPGVLERKFLALRIAQLQETKP